MDNMVVMAVMVEVMEVMAVMVGVMEVMVEVIIIVLVLQIIIHHQEIIMVVTIGMLDKNKISICSLFFFHHCSH